MAKNVAVGVLRPHNYFFYEIDCKKGEFRILRKRFENYAKIYLKKYCIFRTKHGYHLIGKLKKENSQNFVFNKFSYWFPSDYTKELKPRFHRKNPQILRLSEKFSLQTGRVTSPKPKFICGNFQPEFQTKDKVLYYAK